MKFSHLFCAVTLALASAMPNSAGAQTPTVFTPGITLNAMSDNGKYAISKSVKDDNVDNPRVAGGSIIDLTTRVSTEITAPKGWADVNDVADDGTVVGSEGGKPGYWRAADGAWTTFATPAGRGGSFTAVTPDAHYAVGYFFDTENEYSAYPMMYDLTTGQMIDVPNLPTADLSGEDQHQNVFYGISPDGRYILGEMSQSYLMPVALFSYVYDRQTSTWNAIGFDYDAATGKYTSKVENLSFTNDQYFSCDGRWVTGSAYMVYGGGEMEGGTEAFYPYRYSVEDNVLEVYSGVNDANIAGNKITSDGVVLGSSPMSSPYPTAVIRTGNFFVSLDQIFQQVYGMETPDVVHDYVTGAFEAISADGLTALMVTYDNCYIITMPEPFVALAAKVNLLSNYTLNIAEGSTISRISEIKVTFDRAIDCLNLPQNIKLLDDQGNTVRQASGFQISPTNDHEAVITFRSTTLTPDAKYTIVIPEGMIWLQEDRSVKSAEITISYIGRSEGPVVPISIQPRSGSSVAEFNSNPDFITITFDTPVLVSGNAVCTLYNADDNTEIGNFAATASGSRVSFFPTATYYLYKGSNYKVVIAAGSVTDLSGSGASEEIVLNYRGTYVRQISADDLYVFKSTCDNYDDFIFWKNRFDAPAETPASWGFTANTPWVLVRHSETSTDMALAAHSMFATPAESNDWLITPQLFLPDANTYLAFDAQRYRRSANDVLKVYVISDNAVYNYFNEDLQAKFETEGELIFDEVLPSGATDEGLDCEWGHYTFPLDKYAGKNVYIAFVNNNSNQSAIFLDNIYVMRNMNMLLTNQTPTAIVNADKIQVKGILSVVSEIADYNGVNMKLLAADGTVIDEINDTDVHLTSGDTYNFAFAKELVLTPGEITDYTIQFASGTESMAFVYSVKDLIFEPVKRVVLEEFTGAACGNCPLGIQAIANLERLFPDNFIPLTLRTYNSDMYSAGAVEYTNYLGMDAAPSGRINRGEILPPALRLENDIEFFGRGYTESDGSFVYLWGDAVQDELNVPAEAEVSFTAKYDAETGEIDVPCDVRFAINRENMSVGVFAVVVENRLRTYQLNYFNSYSYPNLGEWGVGGMYSQNTVTTWLADDVVRFVVNDFAFNGTIMPDSKFVADQDYSITLSNVVPNGRLNDPNNCEVVVMLIDRTTGRVINANRSAITIAGINDVAADASEDAEYYNMQGIKIANPEPGNVYIKVSGGKAVKVRF